MGMTTTDAIFPAGKVKLSGGRPYFKLAFIEPFGNTTEADSQRTEQEVPIEDLFGALADRMSGI